MSNKKTTEIPKTEKEWQKLPIPQTRLVLYKIVQELIQEKTSVEAISHKIQNEYGYPTAIVLHNVDILNQKFTGATVYAGSPKDKPEALHF